MTEEIPRMVATDICQADRDRANVLFDFINAAQWKPIEAAKALAIVADAIRRVQGVSAFALPPVPKEG